MMLILLLWSLICFILFITGYSVVKLIIKLSNQSDDIRTIAFDELFFAGFLTLSVLTGFLSIFTPIGYKILLFISIITLILFFINFKELRLIINEALKRVSSFSRFENIILAFFIFFVLTAVVQTITLGDTQSYHAQSIQWIRKYAVVPGLGNIHNGLAFNSMFFVISALFTFQIKDVLIFPLNGICYIVLIIRLFSLYKKENNPGSRWKAVFYILTLLISLLIMIPNLNSPSPDIICGILIIYAFIIILDLSGKKTEVSLIQIILINSLVFSCITYKLSSLFLIGTLFFLLDKEIFKRSLITIVAGIMVISPFIIRNYYLSGYVVYPFPSIDIFNVDWKIPLENAIETKSIIDGWAKISVLPYPEVLKMNVMEWILPWFKLLGFNSKLLVTVNFFSILTFIMMLFKKDFLLAKVQLIIFINLLFWFIMAPDPRFAYGFLFLGFSLTFAYIIKLLEFSAFPGKLKYVNIGLACFLLLIVGRRIMFPVDTIRNTSLWIIPAPFGTVVTKDYYSDFHYRVPVPEGGCFNTEIPCTNYPLTNVVKRGDKLQEGFKVIKNNP